MVRNYEHAVAIQKRRAGLNKPGIAKAVLRFLKKQPYEVDELARRINALPVAKVPSVSQ